MIGPQLDRLHLWLRSQPVLATFTTLTRILLAIGFIPPGMTKLVGEPFTIISPDTPIGSFFEAFFQSGSYYAFVGLSQVAAGVLLLIPRTALLGALLYLPLIGNITVITIAMGFGGTGVITSFMLAANLYLLFWDWHRVRPIFSSKAVPAQFEPIRHSSQRLLLVMAACIALCGVGGGVFLLSAKNWIPSSLAVVGLGICMAVIPLGVAAGWQTL
ncbi:MAG: hypothetical protein V3T83_05980, partial [Acidobacteriota bacterium]